MPVAGGKGSLATWQTRIRDFDGMDRTVSDGLLAAHAKLYGRIERRLLAQVAVGRPACFLKQEYLHGHGIPARMFNGVRVSLEGKLSSVKGAMELRRDSLQRRIARCQGQIARAGEGVPRQWLHQRRRNLGNLKEKQERLESDMAAGRIRLCFGSRRPWCKQYALKANGYCGHAEWLRDWRTARSDEFLVLGSRGETAVCQLCVAGIGDDGSLTLRLRLPDALSGEGGKYLVITGVRFGYGHEQVLAVLESYAEYARCFRQQGEKAARQSGLVQAASYRFQGDGRGWRVFVSTRMNHVPVVTDKARGAIGVDLNAEHLAVAETDAHGNQVKAWRVPRTTNGKSRHQTDALIGDAAASLVGYARDGGSPWCWTGWTSGRGSLSWRGVSPLEPHAFQFSFGRVRAPYLLLEIVDLYKQTCVQLNACIPGQIGLQGHH